MDEDYWPSTSTGELVKLRSLAKRSIYRKPMDTLDFTDEYGKRSSVGWPKGERMPPRTWALLPDEARARVPEPQRPIGDVPPRGIPGHIASSHGLLPLRLLTHRKPEPDGPPLGADIVFVVTADVDAASVPKIGRCSRFRVGQMLHISAPPLAVTDAEAISVHYAAPGSHFAEAPRRGWRRGEGWRVKAANTMADIVCEWSRTEAALPLIEAAMRDATEAEKDAAAGMFTKRSRSGSTRT